MRNEKTKKIVYSAMFAAIIFALTMLHVPIGVGGYIHVGDAAIYIAASCIGGPYALVSAAVGAALADLASGYATYALPTAIIKVLIALPFVLLNNKGSKILNIKSALLTILTGVITVLGYFITDLFLFREGAVADIAPNIIQAVGSAVVFIVLAFALDKLKIKQKIFTKKSGK